MAMGMLSVMFSISSGMWAIIREPDTSVIPAGGRVFTETPAAGWTGGLVTVTWTDGSVTEGTDGPVLGLTGRPRAVIGGTDSKLLVLRGSLRHHVGIGVVACGVVHVIAGVVSGPRHVVPGVVSRLVRHDKPKESNKQYSTFQITHHF